VTSSAPNDKHKVYNPPQDEFQKPHDFQRAQATKKSHDKDKAWSIFIPIGSSSISGGTAYAPSC